ncbi:Olee1-like protein [Dorcoceras hygrometricum]|uniref:Olee1-like protein n=1 Tax=Dorcoceras hygrometricum TaxID=472368 RepID=A0A2Z7CVI7_9LAMI|nr:Olee1-like protein [Dorcoceras hygrometricum]
MARLTQVALLFAGLLCLMCLSGIAHSASPQFFVEGKVYCEVCRANFINKLSEPMAGAKVRLECREEEAGSITYSVEGETNDQGLYRLPVQGDHDEEICEVTLVKSSRPDCDDLPDEGWAQKPVSRVTLTSHNGIQGNTRNANPLGFAKKVALPQCSEVFKELADDQDF